MNSCVVSDDRVFVLLIIALLSTVMSLTQAERIGGKGEDELVGKGRMLPGLTAMGADFTLECGQKMLDCVTLGSAPWECIGGITCSGKSAVQCVKMAG